MSNFSFGAPAPAPSGAFSFGGGGGAPGAPATASNPPTSAFSFSGAQAPASTGLFGAAPGPSSSAGGFFGSTTAGAPAAPGGSGGFGFAATASAAPTTAAGPLFGGFSSTPAPFAQQQQQQQQQTATGASSTIAGSMQYATLAPEMKQAIDNIYQAMMQHKRTMLSLQSAGPTLLRKPSGAGPGAAAAAASDKTQLQENIQQLRSQLQRLEQDVQQLFESTNAQMKGTEKISVDTTMYALWPVQELAVRKNVRLTSVPSSSSSSSLSSGRVGEEKKTEHDDVDRNAKFQLQIREALQQGLATVDQITRIPSPYYWSKLHELELRTLQMKRQVEAMHQQLQRSRVMQQRLHQVGEDTNAADAIAHVIETQHLALRQVEGRLRELSRIRMEQIRLRYNYHERGENVLEKAAVQKLERQARINEQVQMHYLKAAAAAAAATPAAPGGYGAAVPAPTGGLFASTAPAPFTSTAAGFGTGTTTTPAPAPSGGLFGTTPTPAPAGGLFGTTPAPASTAFSFGPTTAAPAGGSTSLFGTAPTPAAAAPGLFSPAATATGGFASSTTTTPSSKKKSSSGSRSGGRLKK